MELSEYSFETEFPQSENSYSTQGSEFKEAGEFLRDLQRIREAKVPIRFVYGVDASGNGSIETVEGESVSVLIEEMEITDKAGEEGDKYVSFKLLEYKEYGKKIIEIADITSLSTGKATGKRKVTLSSSSVNPKSSGYYTVKPGDSLWSIAKSQYGDGSRCNIIFNANKDIIKDPGSIKAGQKLKIPAESEFSKYSAALPKIETKVTINKTDTPTSSFTITGYQGGTTPSGRTHSSGGGSFGKTHSSGGGSF
jgi:LysM repeat protein